MKREDFYEEYANNLEGEYKAAYKKIDGMLHFMSGEFNSLGSNMSEVVDLLLTAQKEEKPVSSVLGDDLYAFCCGMINGTKFSIKECVIQYLFRLRFLVIGFLFLSFGDLVFPGEGEEISIIVVGIYISIVYLPLECLLSFLAFKLGKYVGEKGKICFYIKMGLQLVAWVVLVLQFTEIPVLMQLSDLVPLEMDTLLLTVLCGFIEWTKYQRKKAASEEEDIKLADLVFTEDFDESLYDELQKVYGKYQKKRTKRKKEVLDFVSWDEKKLKQFSIGDKWGSVFYCVLVLGFLGVSICTMEFESTFDFIIFLGLQIVTQVLIWRFISNFQKRLYMARLKLHKKIVEMSIEE